MTTIIRAWREQSAVELSKMRQHLDTAIPFTVTVHDTGSDEVLNPSIVVRACDAVRDFAFVTKGERDADDPRVYVFLFSCQEYPCVTEHLLTYGDTELLRLLQGVVHVENLPHDLYIPPHLPQAWIDTCIDVAELTAPWERRIKNDVEVLFFDLDIAETDS